MDCFKIYSTSTEVTKPAEDWRRISCPSKHGQNGFVESSLIHSQMLLDMGVGWFSFKIALQYHESAAKCPYPDVFVDHPTNPLALHRCVCTRSTQRADVNTFCHILATLHTATGGVIQLSLTFKALTHTQHFGIAKVPTTLTCPLPMGTDRFVRWTVWFGCPRVTESSCELGTGSYTDWTDMAMYFVVTIV